MAREHILAGDIFQVVLAQRFTFDLGAEPFDVYRVLRQINPSPYMYFLRTARGVSLVGSSPEPMVQLLDGRVISRPIAGTRYRGRTERRTAASPPSSIEHPKERGRARDARRPGPQRRRPGGALRHRDRSTSS